MSLDIDPAVFRETLGNYPTGVAVVTALNEAGDIDGMVVGTFSSVSLDPPLITFFPARTSAGFERIRNAKAFCVNVLASDQESVCRQVATVREGKFDGIGWRPAPLGSPVLDGSVVWLECTFDDILEAGDHFIVLGRVQELAVERSTLPLLFFQGGYGRFSPGSFIAAPQPELLQAAHVAESLRTRVDDLARDFSVNCSVLAKVQDDAVQVLAVSRAPVPDPSPLGHRQLIVPPLGAVFMVDAPADQVQSWLGRAQDPGAERLALYSSLLDKVRERGYSLLASEPTLLDRHREALTEYEASERLPRKERTVRRLTSELADLFCPDLVPGQLYDIASVVVPLVTAPDLPPMAVRMTGLPRSATTSQIESWIQGLLRVAASLPIPAVGR